MKGGLYIPPNVTTLPNGWQPQVGFNEGGALYPPEHGQAHSRSGGHTASMKGGLYIPPNMADGSRVDHHGELQ